MKSNIAFDLDGVLINLIQIWKNIALQDYGVKYVDNNTFQFKTDPIISNNKIWKIFYEVYKMWKETPVFDGAQELLTKLYEKTRILPLIITARPIKAATETYMVVDKFLKNIPYQLILTQGFEDKLLYLRDYHYFVDDRRKTAMYLHAHGKYMFVPKRNYNEMETTNGIEFIDGVHDLIPRINEFIYFD